MRYYYYINGAPHSCNNDNIIIWRIYDPMATYSLGTSYTFLIDNKNNTLNHNNIIFSEF